MFRILSVSKKRCCFFLIFFFFFFYSSSGAIYLFHRPMVTKPISVTRSNGRLGRCTKSWCAKNEQNITRIPKTRTKNAVRFALFSVKKYFYQTYTNDLQRLIQDLFRFQFRFPSIHDHFFRISQQIGDIP